ncbi:MAG: response regulator transcription factor [Thiolinea sp.]
MFNIMVLEDIEATGDWMKALLLKTFPDVTVIVCHTLAEAREQSGKQSLALALLDLNLPDGSGLEIIPLIRQQNPETRIIVMTIFDDQEHIFKAIRAGAMGYLLKDQSEKILINKLRGVMEGDPPLSPAIARKILEQVRSSHEEPENSQIDPALHINLNHREEEILILISKGMNRTEIAEILSLSPHTVARYIKDVYQKLDVSSRAEAAIMACRIGLIRMS